MTLISAPTGSNSPGVSVIRLIYADDIVKIGQANRFKTLVTPMVLKAGADIVTMWFGYDAEYNEDMTSTEAGQSWKYKLDWAVPKDDSTLATLYDLLANKNLVAVYADGNGLCRIVGTKNYPCQLAMGFGTSPNEMGMSLSGTGVERALYMPANLMDASLLKAGAFSTDFTFGYA